MVMAPLRPLGPSWGGKADVAENMRGGVTLGRVQAREPPGRDALYG